ncbi:hypothetical protein JOF28_000457 [Leucobacter exalbidus]|uniref:DUF3099 domain-containing protein n=1 Tax=Leucobacter exalbidus TaxID=662960 RepID=A0A940PLA2_9MICO|nr:DUF3099 domain-containing protein [Leucobacter exalbidus]MBP1325225.1 hypothetical protein [Leucobacter exalbidus]
MSQEYRVTSAGVSAAEDRSHRMRMYFIAMALRVACVVSLFWVHGWWVILPAIGTVVLPWFAVMVGNAVATETRTEVDAPEPLEIHAAPEADSPADEPTLIVLDVEPARRSARSAAPGYSEGRTADRTADHAPEDAS